MDLQKFRDELSNLEFVSCLTTVWRGANLTTRVYFEGLDETTFFRSGWVVSDDEKQKIIYKITQAYRKKLSTKLRKSTILPDSLEALKKEFYDEFGILLDFRFIGKNEYVLSSDSVGFDTRTIQCRMKAGLDASSGETIRQLKRALKSNADLGIGKLEKVGYCKYYVSKGNSTFEIELPFTVDRKPEVNDKVREFLATRDLNQRVHYSIDLELAKVYINDLIATDFEVVRLNEPSTLGIGCCINKT